MESTAKMEEMIQREEQQVQQLEAALAQVDLRIKEGEKQLQLASVGVSEAPSLASTAPTGPPSADQLWQERAKALEREIRCEAAQATELQDRVHWLRSQLRRQPTSQDP